MAAYLLEQGVYFDNVYGVSAGSSNAVNYLSRDINRTVCSFTEFMQIPATGNMRTFLQHKGLFNAHYIYQEAGLADGPIPFDMQTFSANPAQVCIASFERDTGRDVFFRKDDMPTPRPTMP